MLARRCTSIALATSHPVVLALDVGTTWCKALAFDRHGRVVAERRRPTGLGGPGAAGLDAVGDGVLTVLGELADGLPEGSTPAALGVAAAFYPGVCLDGAGLSFALPLAWTAPPDSMERLAANPGWGAGGMLAHGSAGLMALRLLGLTAERGRIQRAGALISFVGHVLTGSWAIDPASGPGGHSWPAPVVAALAGSAEALPAVVPSGGRIGALTESAARRAGLPAGLPVAMGGHDGACANLGALACRPGDCCLTLSTNFVPRAVAAGPVPGLYGYPVGLAGWASATAALWAGRRSDLAAAACDGGPTAVGGMRHRALGEAASAARRAKLAFPESALAREPARQAACCRDLLGHGWTPGQVYGGVVRGALLEMLAILDRIAAAGLRPTRYVATGGLAQSAFIAGELAHMLGAPVEVARGEAAARGAAAAAAVVARWSPDIETAARSLAPPSITARPDAL